ncbi:MAG: T9SS type A sorting domain-containing protein [Bacteroidota bacterium]
MRFASLVLLLVLASAAHAQTRYTWIGGNGDWTEPANWSPNGVPTAADTAAIASSGILTVTLTEATTVAGLEIERLATVAGDFDLTVTERFLWAGGGSGLDTFRGAGTITIASGALLHMAEGTSRFQMSDGRVLVNNGTILWDGSGIWQGQGRLVNNGELVLAMEASSAFGIVFSALSDGLTNSVTGTIRRTGDGEVNISAGFVNDGLVRIESGVLTLIGFNATGTSGSGSIEIQDGTELRTAGLGRHTQARVTGSTAILGGRQLRVTETFDVTTTRLANSSAGLTLDADATTADLTIEGGILDGSGTLTVTGALDWTGGRMEGSGTTVLGPTIPLTIGGDRTITLSGTRTLRTEGPVAWTGDTDFSGGSTDATFESAGTLTSSGAGERLCNVAFRNTGTLVHDGGALRFNGPMDNDGVLQLLDGTVRMNGTNGRGGTSTGRYEIADTGRLEYTFSTWTLAESAEVVGTGTVAFIAGRVINGATWRPGGPGVGTLTIEGNWPALEPEGVIEFQVGGTVPGTAFDRLDVAGAFAAGGTARVALTGGFSPAATDTLLLVAATDGGSGRFDGVDLPDTTPMGYLQAMSQGVRYGLGEPVSSEDDAAETLPTAFALDAPYPNPVATTATVAYAVPEATAVRVVLYDVLGRQIAVLAAGTHAAGRYDAALDAARLPSGVYVVRMEAHGVAVTRRLTVVR